MKVFEAPTPYTLPEASTTAPLPGLLLLHVPPPELASVVVAPVHTVRTPVIGDGNGLTVTTTLLAQPVPSA